MKIEKEKFEANILDEKGEVSIIRRKIEKDEGEGFEFENEEMTVKGVVGYCLLKKNQVGAVEKDSDPETNLERYEIWARIQDGNYSFTNEEIELIKKLVAEKTEILVAGQVIKNLCSK